MVSVLKIHCRLSVRFCGWYDAVIAKFKNYGDAYILKGDIYAMQDNGGEAATWKKSITDSVRLRKN